MKVNILRNVDKTGYTAKFHSDPPPPPQKKNFFLLIFNFFYNQTTNIIFEIANNLEN